MDTISYRLLEEGDYTDLFIVIDSQREYLGEWLNFIPHTIKAEDTQHFVKNDIADDTTLTYAVLCDNLPKGLSGLKNIDNLNKKAEIGYWLSKDLQGSGVMTNAVKMLLNIAFGELGLNRVMIKAAVENKKSRTLAKRLGFTHEGIERAGEFLNGKFTDLAVYSKLRDE